MKPEGNYYNEFDPEAAAILRALIAEGCIAPGIVDERSIEDVLPDELAGYTQCHFFAGIGIWSLALRAAGVPDDTPLWTGSCPCQPFSPAGNGKGMDDERHLWPHFYHLISQRRPATILGEQVATKAVEPWIDLVHADLEALGYAFGCVPFPAAGVGAPHIRDRNYWSARLGDAGGAGLAQRVSIAGVPGRTSGRDSGEASERASIHVGGLANDTRGRWGEECSDLSRLTGRSGAKGLAAGRMPSGAARGLVIDADTGAGPTNGLWRAADWLLCRDGKWRPVEPGTFPLAHAGAFRNRVATLRGAGNAINLAAAQIFIESVMSHTPQGGDTP